MPIKASLEMPFPESACLANKSLAGGGTLAAGLATALAPPEVAPTEAALPAPG